LVISADNGKEEVAGDVVDELYVGVVVIVSTAPTVVAILLEEMKTPLEVAEVELLYI
jgi:hypothetical protein